MLTLLTIFIICVVIIIYFERNEISTGATLLGLITGALIHYLIKSIVDLKDNNNWKSSQRKLKRGGFLKKDTLIRISFAYLFRIKIDGKYFLVQNTRTKKYQPVGGAYKFFDEEASYLADYIPCENDNRIPVDKTTKQDYRLLVKNKYLRKFVKRFNKTRDRENIMNLSREFVEELFTTNILDESTFDDLTYKYSGRHMTNVAYDNVFNHYELLLADIIEVKLTSIQEELFRNLMEKDCRKYRFAQADEIKSHGVSEYGTDELTDDIANHTVKILSENTDELVMRNKHKKIINIQF